MHVQILTLPQALVPMDGTLLQGVLTVLSALLDSDAPILTEHKQPVVLENTQWLDGLSVSSVQLDIYAHQKALCQHSLQ